MCGPRSGTGECAPRAAESRACYGRGTAGGHLAPLDVSSAALGATRGAVLGGRGSADAHDVLGVVADAEVAADYLSDPRGSPQLGPPAVGFGALQKQRFELPELYGVEAWCAAGVRLGSKLGRGFPLLFQPGVDGRPAAAQEACNHCGMFALLDELNGAATPAFEFLGSTNRSNAISTMATDRLFS
jgi:hypothetical protein